MNQWLWNIFRISKYDINYEFYRKMNQLDKNIFQGWLKKTYWFFVLLNLLYLCTYEGLNEKFNIKPNYKPTFIEISAFTGISAIPLLNIFNICLAIGEDIELIKNGGKK